MKLNLPFQRHKPSVSELAKPLIDPDHAAKLKASAESISKPAPPKPRKSQGRVIKELRHPEFDPRGRRSKGGRVVKAMPRQLQNMQRAQEKVEDDGGQPKIEDIQD